MASERPAKRVKLLSDDDSTSSSDEGGISLTTKPLKVNEEFARRFEHNQKRAERQRLEEKYGKGDLDDSDDESSTDEEEDDDAMLANGALDEQFQATLKALRSKDPVVYKKDVKFYEDEEGEDQGGDNGDVDAGKKEKPMYLMDYHRQNLLSGRAGKEEDDDEDGDVTKPTFAQEQEAIRKSVIKELHGAANSDSDASDGENDGGFLVKSRPQVPETNGKRPTTTIKSTKVSAQDDPDAFLDDFLTRRAWVPASDSKMHAFESDDEEYDLQAEEFEQAYNMRFEDPDASKGKLVSHARDIAAKYSVRQDATTKRQRAREGEKAQKLSEKEARKADKARLKKLKLDEAEEKLRKIKETAGLKGKEFDMDEWSAFLTGDWDDTQWEKEFEKRFGDDYYAEQEQGDDGSEDEEGEDGKKKRKPRKPKFDDDIDITDLIPDYEDEEKAKFALTDDEVDNEVEADGDENVDDDDDEEEEEASTAPRKKGKSRKEHKRAIEEAKRQSRRERRKLEALISDKMDTDLALDSALASSKSKKGKTEGPSFFRYRETSPTSYGLSAQEILMATDAQLNSLVGLKKLATFRDDEKKRKDKKRLGKKARLRQWRKDTFGNEEGPTRSFEEVVRDAQMKDA